MSVARSSSTTSVVWVCSCGARDLARTSTDADSQIEGHLYVCQEAAAVRKAAAEALARRRLRA